LTYEQSESCFTLPNFSPCLSIVLISLSLCPVLNLNFFLFPSIFYISKLSLLPFFHRPYSSPRYHSNFLFLAFISIRFLQINPSLIFFSLALHSFSAIFFKTCSLLFLSDINIRHESFLLICGNPIF